MIKLFLSIMCSALLIASLASAQTTTTTDYRCGQDLNGDNILDANGETASCTAMDGGQLCPISSANCIIKTTDPVCPTIAPLNPLTSKCEMPPQCASGAYDSSKYQCILTTAPSCANPLASFNSGRNLCESPPRCEGGAYYDPVGDRCITVTAYTCPLNTVLNIVTDKCDATPTCLTGTFNTSTNQCEIHTTSASICPAGTAINPVSDRCEAALTCLFGTYNTVQNMCLDSMAAVCPSGTSLSMGSGKCESTPFCSTGTYDVTLKSCVVTTYSSPTCPTGSTLNTNIDLCVADALCPVNTIYNSFINMCVSDLSCPSGTYDPVSNTCISTASYTPVCPAGASFTGGAADLCTSPPLCPAGTTLNGSICTFAALCPPGGTFNAATDQCAVPYTSTSTPICNGGGTLNPTSDLCESATSCPSGYTPSGSTCVAYSAPYCGSPGWIFPTGAVDTANNRCYMDWSGSGWGFPTTAMNCSNNCYGAGSISMTYISYTAGTRFALAHCRCSYGLSCSAGYSYDSTLKSCVQTASPFCTVGTLNTNKCESSPSCSSGTYDGTINLCVTPGIAYSAPSCLAGTTYSSANDRCETSPVCTAPTTYSISSGQCQSSPTCLAGIFIPSADACVQTFAVAPTCPFGGTVNGTVDKCARAATCAAGTTWDATLGKCKASLTCASGSYNSALNQCVTTTSTTPSCALGAWNGTTGKCESVPTCTTPSYTYDITLKTCVYRASPQCPLQTSLNIGSDVCDSAPTCQTSSYIYHPELDICSWDELFPAQCPAGTMINVLTNRCDSSPTCSLGVYDNSANNCLSFSASYCGSSAEATNTTTDFCESYPLCSSGTYDNLLHQCITPSEVTCPVGGIFNRTRHVCEANPGCTTGSLDPSSGMCANIGGFKTPAVCDVGALNLVSDQCESSPACSAGSYDPLTDMCVAHSYTVATCSNLGSFPTTYNPASGNCYFTGTSAQCTTAGGVYQFEANVGFACTRPLCSSPLYSGYDPSTSALSCISDNVSTATCVGTSTLNISSNKCDISPACAPDAGLYDPVENMCVSFKWSCPYDTASNIYQCLDNAGVKQCSPNACVDIVTNPPVVTETDPGYLVDDGVVDQSTGQCIGQIIMFNGVAAQCKPPGIGTNGFDCCNSETASDFVNCAGALAVGGAMVGPANCGMFGDPVDFMTRCGQEGMMAVAGVNARRTHLIGHYCTTSWPIIGCVQRAKMYCVFTTKLGRIIHEQGRPQLIAFGADGGWGPTQSPNCRGFSPEEFGMLDFSKIDLSEFISDIQTNMIPNVQQQMQDNVTNFYNNTQ